MKLGDMTPEQQREACKRAMQQLQEELSHPAMQAALSAPIDDVHFTRKPYDNEPGADALDWYQGE